MRIGFLCLGFAALFAHLSLAHAATDDECIASAIAGQRLQKEEKFAEAQARFFECAKPECPAEVTSSCTGFLRSAQDLMPSILIVLKGADGKERVATQQTVLLVDGKPLPGALRTSDPISLNPGAHEIRVTGDGIEVTQKITLRKFEKGRLLSFQQGPSPVIQPAPAKPGTAAAPAKTAIPTMAYVAGGAALVGLGVFTAFGIMGINDRANSACNTGCAEQDYSRVQSKFLVADIALGVGVVGAVAAAAFLLFGGNREDSKTGAARFSPVVRF
jgi:hypothetical protein